MIDQNIIKYENVDENKVLQRILDSLDELFCLFNEDFQIVWTNKAAADSLNMEKEELVGKHCYELWAQQSTPCSDCPVLKSLHTKQPEHIEKKTTDGRYWQLQGSVFLREDDSVHHLVVLGLDITEKKKAEIKSKETEEKLKNLLKSSSEFIWQVDENGVYTYVSDGAVDIIGYKKVEIIGKTPFDFMESSEAERVGKIFSEIAQKKEKIIRLEDTMVSKTGNHVVFETDAMPLFDKNNMLTGYFGICRDITERKKIENTVIENEKKFRHIVNNIREVLYVYDPQIDKFLFVSPSFEKVWEMPVERVLDDPLAYTKVVHPDDQEVFWEAVRREHEEDDYFNLEYRIVMDDGRIKWIWSRNFPVSDEHKTVGISEDITERKKVELRHRQVLDKFQNLFYKNVDMLFIHEMNADGSPGPFVEVNDSFCENLGYSREEIKSLSPVDISKDNELREENIREAMWEKRDYLFERIMVTKHGDEIPVEVHGSIFELEGQPVVIGIARDITERKHAEQKIKESEQKYRELFNTALVGISVHDAQGSIVAVNDTAEEVFGIDEAELMEKNVDFWQGKLINADGTPMNGTDFPLSVVAESKMPSEGRVIGLKMSNYDDIRWFLHSARPILDKKGDIDKVITSFVEITERKKAEQELKEAHDTLKDLNRTLEEKVEKRTDRIQQLLKQKDEFINQLGHDLKNPLGPFVQLLPILKRYIDDEKGLQMLDVLDRNANYMRNLVKKTIDLAKLNSAKTPFSFEHTCLRNLVNDVISVNKQLFEDHDISIDNLISAEYSICVDVFHIQEVFTNLFNNAVKYTESPGKITIDAKQAEDKILVSVKDKGIGISSDHITHLFDEYYKVDHSRHDFDSSGLGLPICKRIVERHGGIIWAESEGLGKGSTFYFTLPKSNKEKCNGKTLEKT